MNVLVVLIPVSLILGGIGLVAFLWTVRSDQYDDDKGNAARILLDDGPQGTGDPDRT
jgi:cbb3-type cytochrome oxidase maturation protein